MTKQRLCGNCTHFFKIKVSWWKSFFSRNGLCNKYDLGTHSDSRTARYCKGYQPLKHNRKKSS